MTIAIEHIYSIRNTRRFLKDLANPQKTPNIPKCVRKEALSCLKHYPTPFEEQNMLQGICDYNKEHGLMNQSLEECGFEEQLEIEPFNTDKPYWWDRNLNRLNRV